MTIECRVEELQPAAIVTLAGTLDDAAPTDAEPTLRDCLATIPAVMLLDITSLSVGDCGSLGWLREFISGAAEWPSVPVYVCGGDGVVADCSLPSYPSLDVAKKAWAGVSTPERRSLILPPDPASCARARTFVGNVCGELGITRPARLAELLTSELVANAVVHARSALAVTVRPYGRGVELSVRDDGPGTVPDKLPDDPRGFGLQLVDAMSDAWGSAPTGEGKVVWTRIGV